MPSENPCICVVAVKEKSGSQDCLLCGGDAHDNHFVFSHTPEGLRLLDHNQNPDGASAEDMESISQGVLEGMSAPPAFDDPADDEPAPVKPKRAAKTKTTKVENPLLDAIEFIQLAQRPKGDPMATHCCIRFGAVTAFDRTIAAGIPISYAELDCFPNSALLSMALSRCVDNAKIIQHKDSLYIESGSFSAHVPLSAPQNILTAIPDQPIAPLDDRFRTALKTVGKLVKEAAPKLIGMAIQLNPYTVIATNGAVVIEAYHGSDMPPIAMLIPKRFADVLNKTKKKIVAFGYSQQTFTVHFEDRSWLRTNLYREKFSIDLVAHLNIGDRYKRPVPDHFFEAALDVAKWSGNGCIYCFDNRISSHPPHQQHISAARAYAMPGFDDCYVYDINALKMIQKLAKSIDNKTSDRFTLFWGEFERGGIAHQIVKMDAIETKPKVQPVNDSGITKCYACRDESYSLEKGYCIACGNDIAF